MVQAHEHRLEFGIGEEASAGCARREALEQHAEPRGEAIRRAAIRLTRDGGARGRERAPRRLEESRRAEREEESNVRGGKKVSHLGGGGGGGEKNRICDEGGKKVSQLGGWVGGGREESNMR